MQAGALIFLHLANGQQLTALHPLACFISASLLVIGFLAVLTGLALGKVSLKPIARFRLLALAFGL
jgi:hypothetical protein